MSCCPCPNCGYPAYRTLVRHKNGNPWYWSYRCIWNNCHATHKYGYERDRKLLQELKRKQRQVSEVKRKW